MKIKITLIIIAIFSLCIMSQAQEIDVNKMTREEILSLPYEKLMELPIDQLMLLVDKVGVSSLEDLYDIFLNKDVSSSSKRKERVFESPMSTSVLTHQEIEASGATSIVDALRLLPGMIVREKTNGNYDVHIRGFDNLPNRHMMVYSENSISLIMIDGRPVYNYAHGGTFWETLPVGLNDIERIELVRGPSSALYGPNAVSGVVNIITKKVTNDEMAVNGGVSYGSQSTTLANINLSKGFNKKFSFRLSSNLEYRKRNSEELYVFIPQDYFTIDEFDDLKYLNPVTKVDSLWVLNNEDDVNELFPDPELAMKRYGVNGFFNYMVNKDINLNLSLGTQNSDINSSTLGDNPSPLAGRLSNTQYFDFKADIHGVKAQVNYLTGVQNVIRGNNGFEIDVNQLHANLEYNYQYKDLNIRPGISYMNVTANDLPHLQEGTTGFLNGTSEINSIAASLRADYLAFGKLRLIGALRAEKYNYPDDPYLTYQFIASYLINDKNNIRFVHSRANRSPFLVDTWANYTWNRETLPKKIQMDGNKQLDLLTSDYFELGYRTKPWKSIVLELEGYHTQNQNFGGLYADSASVFNNIAPTGYVHMSYQNIDLVAKQTGVNISASWVANENLIFKAFGNIQQTKLENEILLKHDDITFGMVTHAIANGYLDIDGDGNPESVSPSHDLNGDGKNETGFLIMDLNNDGKPETPVPFFDLDGDGMNENAPPYLDGDNDGIPETPTGSTPWSTTFPDEQNNSSTYKATPTFYGGFTVNYLTKDKKLNACLSSYFYGKQTFINKYEEYDLDSKLLLNLKVSYKVWNENTVFINGRNILNNTAKEFAFMDDIGGIYMAGLSFKF